MASDLESEGGTAVAEAPEPSDDRMDLSVEVEEVGPCRKHVRVTIPRSSIDEVMDRAVGEFSDQAAMPGFRAGRVPPALVRKRFKEELSDQVKQTLLLQSLEQVSEEQDLDPINEPDLDVEALDIPDEGDFEYEFDVEVRPDFKLPQYKGLKIDRPGREVDDADVEAYQVGYLEQYASVVDVERPAELGDQLVASVVFRHDGKKVNNFETLEFRLRKTLDFPDAALENAGELLTGVSVGDVKTGTMTVTLEADRIDMRGEEIEAEFTIKAVKEVRIPEMNEEFMDRLDIESEAELSDRMYSNLTRQIEYQQRQATREQVLEKIQEAADWDLPEELVRKQTENAMRREILEMQQAGFTGQQIRARENDLRQQVISNTRRNLKEHFVLDRVADEENIEVGDSELEYEIQVMAYQAGENPRRVRSRMIKTGVIENLRAQIRERKAVDVILASADFTDTEMKPLVDMDTEAVSRPVCPPAGAAAVDEAADDVPADDIPADDAEE